MKERSSIMSGDSRFPRRKDRRDVPFFFVQQTSTGRPCLDLGVVLIPALGQFVLDKGAARNSEKEIRLDCTFQKSIIRQSQRHSGFVEILRRLR